MINDLTYEDAFVQGVRLTQLCEECVLCAEHRHTSAGDRAAGRILRTTAKTTGEIGRRIAGFTLLAFQHNPDAVRAQIAADVEAALQARDERAAKIAEAMRPSGGRMWTDEQDPCFSALTDCAANIRNENTQY